MEEYKHIYKIRLIGHEEELNKLLELYGGEIVQDGMLFLGEYWYHTDCERETLKNSTLVNLLE